VMSRWRVRDTLVTVGVFVRKTKLRMGGGRVVVLLAWDRGIVVHSQTLFLGNDE
jgi:hypothetical protein